MEMSHVKIGLTKLAGRQASLAAVT
jgi:hypothetical protein